MKLPTDIEAEIYFGDVSKVKALVEKDPQVVNRLVLIGTPPILVATPIHLATGLNRVDIVTYLLDHGADINHEAHIQAVTTPGSFEMHGSTALHLACMKGHSKVVDLLLERGADPTIHRSGDGATPLMKTSSSEVSLECLRRLLSHDLAKTTINARCDKGMTALHYACLRNDREMVKLLLQAGADISVADKYGCTPMTIAQMTKHQRIVKVLQVRPWPKHAHWFISDWCPP